MAWLEIHQTLPGHIKVKRAARMLGISRAQVIGHLVMLWTWALDQASDGELSSFAPAEIADEAGWDGDPDSLLGALVESRGASGYGFLERDDRGTRIHDWTDYAGRLIERRRANAERMRQTRAGDTAGHVRDTCNAQEQRVRQKCEATVPYRTLPDRTQPDRTQPSLPLDGVVSNGRSNGRKKTRATHVARDANASQVREDQVFFSVLSESLGWTPKTASERGAANRAIKEMREAGVTAGEIPGLVARWPIFFGPAVCTPSAIARHLGQLRDGQPPAQNGKAGRPVDRSVLGTSSGGTVVVDEDGEDAENARALANLAVVARK